jgi:hypothetical protein
MRPSAVDVLRETAQRVEREVVPSAATANDAATAMFAVFIMSAVADHWDNAAAWRHEENQSLRSLFRDAAPIIGERSLAADMEREAKAPASGLRISELDAENDRLLAMLVRLDGFLDDSEGTDVIQRLRKRVFSELRATANRRAFVTQPV